LKIIIGLSPNFLLPFYYKILSKALLLAGKKYKKIILKNLEIAFPDKTDTEKEKLVRESFLYLSRLMIDLIKFPTIEKIEKRIEKGDISSLENSLKSDKGIILISGHFGNWESGLLWLGKFVSPINIITRRMDNPYIEKLLKKIREQTGNKIIHKDNRAALKILKLLRHNKSVGLMVDLNQQKKEGIFIDFFSKKASTSPAAAIFHLKTGAPIIFAFCIPKGKGYKIYTLPPITHTPTGDKQKDIEIITRKINKTLEDEIRRYPSSYFWFHKRWKERPTEEEKIY
jgi:KDO2-lipid IV(A) lauroyltransferase